MVADSRQAAERLPEVGEDGAAGSALGAAHLYVVGGSGKAVRMEHQRVRTPLSARRTILIQFRKQ